MKVGRFFFAITLASALRMLSLTSMVRTSGHMGGISSATALCCACSKNYLTADTTWVPLLETSPGSLRDYVEGFGSVLYPYMDALSDTVIWQSSMFAPGATIGVFQENETVQRFTGVASNTCQSWTNTTGVGGNGLNVLGDRFLVAGSLSCSSFASISCLEVPRTKALAPPIRFFITDKRYSGNLGGLMGADSQCNEQANSLKSVVKGMNSKWFAILNTKSLSSAARIASVASSQSIYLFGNVTPGTNLFYMLNHGAQAIFGDLNLYSFNQSGHRLAASNVWIGSETSGSDANCNDFTTVSGRGWFATSNGASALKPLSSTLCDNYFSLYCLQYFSPFVNSSMLASPALSLIVVSAIMYEDVSWTVFRCVANSAGFMVNVTEFWAQTHGVGGFAVSEALYAGSSSIQATLRGLDVGPCYTTCAIRKTGYIDLTWLVNVSFYIFPSPPTFILSSVIRKTDQISVNVITNETDQMRVRCLAFPLEQLAIVSDFWERQDDMNIKEVTLNADANQPLASLEIRFNGLRANTTYVIKCAQHKASQSSSASTIATNTTVNTLPTCAQAFRECPVGSECINAADKGLFKCSPFIDGGFKFDSRGADNTNLCSSLGGSNEMIRVNTTEGKQNISFCINLGVRIEQETLDTTRFFYGTNSNPKRFECMNATFSNTLRNNTIGVMCVIQRGIGGNLNFSLVYGDSHVISTHLFFYPLPIIKNSTLRRSEFLNSVGSNLLNLELSQDVVAFDVENIQLMSELRVSYGPSYECQLDQRTNASVVVCVTDSSTEFASNGFTFVVDANGQVAHGSDILKVPAGRPVISHINSDACNKTNSSDGLINCPTAGHTFLKAAVITIYGKEFGTPSSQLRITIDGAGMCSVVEKSVEPNNTHWVKCNLPSGTGFQRNVYVQNDIVVSAPRPFISYAPPSIMFVCGCASPCVPSTTDNTFAGSQTPNAAPASNNHIADCNREGGQRIQISGSNFGERGATVLVGVNRCINVTHSPFDPHNQIACTLPPGHEQARALLIAQGNGAVNENSVATVSYEQCGMGTFQDQSSTLCANCTPGHFSSVSGLTECQECKPGTISPYAAATTCIPCERGRFFNESRGSVCDPCDVGSFSAAPYSTRCESCVPGSYSNTSQQSACHNCLSGSSQPAAGKSSCLLCNPGKYQNNVGKADCVACPPGKMTNTHGNDMCANCEAGLAQPRTGTSSCDWCFAGKFIDVDGAAECIECERGKYSNATGASGCSACVAGRSQSAPGLTTCDNCAVGRFANAPQASICSNCELGSVTFHSGASECFVCPLHSSVGREGCSCDPGYAWGNLTCDKCMQGQDCRGVGTLKAQATALPGFVRVGNSLSFQKCIISTHCPGGMNRCAPFRQTDSHLCQSCVEGYREESGNADGACVPCASQSTSLANITAAIVVCIVVLVFLYYVVVRTGMEALTPRAAEKTQWWDTIEYNLSMRDRLGETNTSFPPPLPSEESATEPNKPAEPVRKRKISVYMPATREHRVPVSMAYQRKIIITFIQLTTTSLTLSTLSMPPSFRVVLDAFDFVNLNVIPWGQVGCLVPFSLLTRIVATAIAPLIILPIAASLLVLALKTADRFSQPERERGLSHSLQVASRARKATEKYRAVFAKVTLFTVFLVYPAVSRQIFSYFRCVEVLRDFQPSIYLLKESFKEECYNAEWNSGLGIVIMLICVYPLGVPLVLGLILRHYRPRFQEPSMCYTLGFAFEGFLPQFWYFELVDITHKFFVSCIVTLLPDSAQVPVDMGILGTYLCVLHFAQPYVRKADNQFHMLTQTEIYMLVFSFLARENTGPISLGSEEDLLLSALLLCLFLGILALFVARVVRYAGCGTRLCRN